MGASRRSAVPPFAVMTVLQRVAEARAAGREVISLCAGEPSQGAPSDVRRRLAELMIDRTPLGYSETFGLTTLRQAIAGHYRRWYDLDVRSARSPSPPALRVPSWSASWPRSTPVTGCCSPGRLPGVPQHLDQSRLRGGGAPVRTRRRFQPTRGCSTRPCATDRSRAWCWPRPPTRPAPWSTDAELAAPRRLCVSWRAPGERRDLPRHHRRLRGRRGGSAARLAAGSRVDRVVVLEVRRDDGLAGGLGVVPTSWCGRRCPRGQLALCPPARAARGDRGLHRRSYAEADRVGGVRGTAPSCSTRSTTSDGPRWHPPTAPSTCRPTRARLAPTRTRSRGGRALRRRAWPSHRHGFRPGRRGHGDPVVAGGRARGDRRRSAADQAVPASDRVI